MIKSEYLDDKSADWDDQAVSIQKKNCSISGAEPGCWVLIL